ncbi:MAG: hypothetical protein O2856_08745 [Planctomycetota bacterium]|nr:hypothetical protein [Planctomycetota bacterium]
MQFTRTEQFRAIFTALLTVTLASTAIAQPATRIGRNDTNTQELNRRLQPGELGNLDSLPGTRPLGTNAKPVDLSNVNKQALANLMKEAFDESGRLYTLLEQDYRRYPQLRSLVTDLYSLRSLTSRINQDMKLGIPLETILTDFQRIDADWRVLSHRMIQSTGLSSATLASVDRLNAIDKQVGQQLKVAPTLDYRTLFSKLSVLENALYNISDELSNDLSGTSKTAVIVNDCRKMQQQITRVADLVQQQYPYERVVSEFNRFDRQWVLTLEQLRTANNPYVDRAVSRAVQADSDVHALLWLETSSDRTQLKQIADSLIRNVDEFYSRTPLKLLLSFKNAANTLAIADEFYGTILNLKDNVQRNESDEILIESYRYVEESGAKFARTFSTMQSQQGIVVLRQIEDGMASLRSALNLGGTVTQVDTRRLLPVTASLENLADQLDWDVRHWVNSERPTYRNEVLQASATFIQRTQRMGKMLNAAPTLTELQREADSLYVEWKAIYSYLSRCNTADRPYLSQAARDIIADLRELDSQLRL